MSKYIILLVFLVSVVIGNSYKFSFFSPDVRISTLDMVVITLVLLTPLWVYKRFFHLILPILMFAGIGLVSLAAAYFNYGIGAVTVGIMYLFRWVCYSLLFASFVQYIEHGLLTKYLYIIGLIFTAVGLIQYIFYPDIRHLVINEWDPHFYRVVGTLLDPGFMGIMLVFTLIFITLNPLRNKFAQLTTWAISYLAFALTYSRSSYLALLDAMVYVSWKAKGWRFFLKILLLFAATVLILPRSPDGEGVKLERTSSIEARIINWGNSLTIFADHPLLGVGFNVYRYAQNNYGFLGEEDWLDSRSGAGADSSLLFVAATTGIVGLFVYLWYLHRLFNLNNSLPLKASLIAVITHSFFLNSLFYPFVMFWIALLIGWSLQSVPSGSGSQPGLSRQKPGHSPRRSS